MEDTFKEIISKANLEIDENIARKIFLMGYKAGLKNPEYTQELIINVISSAKDEKEKDKDYLEVYPLLGNRILDLFRFLLESCRESILCITSIDSTFINKTKLQNYLKKLSIYVSAFRFMSDYSALRFLYERRESLKGYSFLSHEFYHGKFMKFSFGQFEVFIVSSMNLTKNIDTSIEGSFVIIGNQDNTTIKGLQSKMDKIMQNNRPINQRLIDIYKRIKG